MTEKLYDTDSHLKEFTAKVLSCRQHNGGYAVVLDRTAFFPEGGGQASDTGTLNGIAVSDVGIKNGVIYHYINCPIAEGTAVSGCIDWQKRFRRMQNHSGEHIVSGIVHRLFGYENVGFHLGEDEVTCDFNGILTREDLLRVERLANEAIYKNARFSAEYPSEEELKYIFYRSKLELTENVRIVTVEGYDACACCAPHVSSASEIGIIKILDFFRNRDGVRVFIKCGTDALDDYNVKYENVLGISGVLSSKQCDTFDAVQKLIEKMSLQKAETAALKRRLIENMADTFDAQNEVTALFWDGLDIRELQLFSDRLYKLYGGIRGVFSESGDGFAFAVCGEPQKLDDFFRSFKNAFSVRGGGRNGMAQGTVCALKKEIENIFLLYQ